MKSRSLPDALQGRAFRTHEASALGVDGARLARAAPGHPTQGVWSTRPIDTLIDRLRVRSLVLPADYAFSHLTAAQLWRLPMRRAEHSPVHVLGASDAPQIRRRECVGHRGLELRHTEFLGGVRVTDLIDTWIDLGALSVGRDRQLTVDDLVVVGDEVLNRLIVVTEEEVLSSYGDLPSRPHLDAVRVANARNHIASRLAARTSPRGVVGMRQAHCLMRAGVRSPQETRARLMLVRAGLPEPEVNGNIEYAAGGWLCEGDLVWRQARVVAEYQSEFHVDRRRRSYDSFRTAELREEGWDVHEIWAEDLAGPRSLALIGRIRRALGL